jgi:sugar phosphate isomerase/epimerase
MELLIYRSLWTTRLDLGAALRDVGSGLFDGIEGPLPPAPEDRRKFIATLEERQIPFIAEIVTGGGYVPTERSPTAHLEELRRAADAAVEARAQFITALAGSDAWSLPESIEFFGRAMDLGKQRGITISFETHRSRPTFTPWATAKLLRQLPDLRLTCDFSHWCCVCERLVLDEEPGLLALCARHAHHIHARVGYAQGPQVPHPAAPEYAEALQSHERWWNALLVARAVGQPATITPEFGPDGYLQTSPFSKQPAADLDEINRWMAQRLRNRAAAAGNGGQR